MLLWNEGPHLDPLGIELGGHNQERKQLTFRLPGFPPEIGCRNKFNDRGTGSDRLNLSTFVTWLRRRKQP
jgi:hypothetical protein